MSPAFVGSNLDSWRSLLAFCDRSSSPFLLQRFSGDLLPVPVYQRLHRDLDRNRAPPSPASGSAMARSPPPSSAPTSPFVVLKGLTSSPPSASTWPPASSTISIWPPPPRRPPRPRCPRQPRLPALTELEDFPTDHLPAMIRKTGWQWRGDYFDPEIPILRRPPFPLLGPVHRTPSGSRYRGFLDRRTRMHLDGAEIPCLDPVDALGYVSLHLLRHLLRGSLKPIHVYELAFFLDRRSADTAFWERCMRSTPSPYAPSRPSPSSSPLPGSAPPGAAGIPPDPQPPAPSWPGSNATPPPRRSPLPSQQDRALAPPRPARNHAGSAQRPLPSPDPAALSGPVDAVYLPESVLTWRIRLRRRAKITSLSSPAASRITCAPCPPCPRSSAAQPLLDVSSALPRSSTSASSSL